MLNTAHWSQVKTGGGCGIFHQIIPPTDTIGTFIPVKFWFLNKV